MARSDLQLLDRQVGIAYSHAQFVSERGEQLDRDVGLLLAQRVKRGRAERKAGQVFIDGDRRRARPTIEHRELTDHGEATETPPKAIIELITQHKPEIIDLLRSDPAGAGEARVSWLDMVVAVDNEAGRHRIWRNKLTQDAADNKLTAVERDTLKQAIASRVRQAAIFDAVLRVIESTRAEFGGDGPWDE